VRIPQRGMCLLATALGLSLAVPDASAQAVSAQELAVAQVLDQLHDAASKADFARYFGLYSDDAIFLGTDATERWTLGEFMAYAKPSFDQGRGWTYTVTERHISISDDGNTAWFDERLDNKQLGECRGSGVLVKPDGAWKVVQYNLTIPIPNALAGAVVDMIRMQPAGGAGD
jgi:ketosteroid isomerase-like protein